jgi:hypothetical protein
MGVGILDGTTFTPDGDDIEEHRDVRKPYADEIADVLGPLGGSTHRRGGEPT